MGSSGVLGGVGGFEAGAATVVEGGDPAACWGWGGDFEAGAATVVEGGWWDRVGGGGGLAVELLEQVFDLAVDGFAVAGFGFAVAPGAAVFEGFFVAAELGVEVAEALVGEVAVGAEGAGGDEEGDGSLAVAAGGGAEGLVDEGVEVGGLSGGGGFGWVGREGAVFVGRGGAAG